jgi:hypothetical protein
LPISQSFWLLSALPVWYFSALAHPFAAGILSLLPSLGTVGLAVGLFAGFSRRTRALLLFLCPLILSEVYVAIAGFNRGRLRGNASALPLCLFFLAQIALLIYILYKTRKILSASIGLSIFSVSYALFAAFIAGMSFADDWL